MARNFNVYTLIRYNLLNFCFIFAVSIVTNNLKQSHIMKILWHSSVAVGKSIIRQRIENRPCRYKSLLRVALEDGRFVLGLGYYNFEQGLFIVYVRSYPLCERVAENLFQLAIDTDLPSLYDCVVPLDSLK